jgi:hypothetical protein
MALGCSTLYLLALSGALSSSAVTRLVIDLHAAAVCSGSFYLATCDILVSTAFVSALKMKRKGGFCQLKLLVRKTHVLQTPKVHSTLVIFFLLVATTRRERRWFCVNFF